MISGPGKINMSIRIHNIAIINATIAIFLSLFFTVLFSPLSEIAVKIILITIKIGVVITKIITDGWMKLDILK